MKISVPSKTFLAGEYLALTGGPALIAATSPRFEYEFREEPRTRELHEVFHPESPAGKFYDEHADQFSKCKVRRIPNSSGLGAGSSTADFLAAFAFVWSRNKKLMELTESLTAQDELLTSYRKYAATTRGPQPSGLDLLAQLRGGLCEVAWGNKKYLRPMPWMFEDLEFLLIKTGIKVPTFEHLQSLEKLDSAFITVLQEKMHAVQDALLMKDAGQFCAAIEGYSNGLVEHGFSHEKSQNLCRALQKKFTFATVRGCGALGADVVALFFSSEKWTEIDKNLDRSLERLASSRDLDSGLRLD